MWLYGWDLLILSYHPAKFGVYMPIGTGSNGVCNINSSSNSNSNAEVYKWLRGIRSQIRWYWYRWHWKLRGFTKNSVHSTKNLLEMESLLEILTKRGPMFYKLVDVHSVTNFIGESISSVSIGILWIRKVNIIFFLVTQ